MDEKLIITKYDIYSNSSNIPQVEYTMYNNNGKQLNMTLCNDCNNEISFPLSNIDFELVDELLNHDINLFNVSDSFYTDICYTNPIKGNDLTLIERRNFLLYVYNHEVCEEGCIYKKINLTTHKSTCSCNNKQSIEINKRSRSINIFEHKVTSLYNMLKCYKLFFVWHNIFDNIGF